MRPISALMSPTLQAAVFGPILTCRGYLPRFTPSHHAAREIGIRGMLLDLGGSNFSLCASSEFALGDFFLIFVVAKFAGFRFW